MSIPDRIIAFDSSLERSAWASFTEGEYSWDARSFIKSADPDFPDLRFNAWRNWAQFAIRGEQPEVCVYEKPTTHGQGSGGAQIMLEMTLRELLAIRRIPKMFIYPSHLKNHITGNGHATKEMMMEAVRARIPYYNPLEDKGGDIADALAQVLWVQDGAPESKAALAKQAAKIKSCKEAVQ